jgi:hypothetical protein
MAGMRKLLNRKIIDQDRKCAICHEEFTDYNDVVPDQGSQGYGRSMERRLSPDGMKVFGVLGLATEMEGCRFCIGLPTIRACVWR